jgi:hypothetical protein
MTRCEAITDTILISLEREVDATFPGQERISRRELLHLLGRWRRDLECIVHENNLEVDQDVRAELHDYFDEPL